MTSQSQSQVLVGKLPYSTIKPIFTTSQSLSGKGALNLPSEPDHCCGTEHPRLSCLQTEPSPRLSWSLCGDLFVLTQDVGIHRTWPSADPCESSYPCICNDMFYLNVHIRSLFLFVGLRYTWVNFKVRR